MSDEQSHPIEPLPEDDSAGGDVSSGVEADAGTAQVGHRPATPPTSIGPTESGVRCIECGHDLSGTAVGSLCPECGSPVIRSLGSASLPTSGKAIASMVLGICSIALQCSCGFPIGLLGILGLFYYARANRDIQAGVAHPSSRGINKAGMITSIIGLAIAVVFGLFVLLAIVLNGF